MAENWTPIPGWEGLYSASDLGRVRSEVRQVRMGNGAALHTIGGRVLKPWATKQGYLLVSLSRGGRKYPVLVHRLVLSSFVGPCPDGMECCHLDDDPSNNQLDNLRWDTRSANQRDVIKNGNHHKVNKTHCPQRHEYDEANTYRPARGGRGCRKCRTRQVNECKARKAARAAAKG